MSPQALLIVNWYQDAIADSDISLTWRQAISDRLNRANHLLAMLTVGGEDSY
uniref:Uncharacterized protein n=1 Tax=Desertifilum tharense IPPAS B-1220 TaxID=1781255 RepID=A0ACD5GS99_9CYAN